MEDIKAGVTLMQDFCTPGSSVYQSYIDYLDREEAQRNNAIQTYNLYHDYMGNPEKSTGLFTDEKNVLSQDDKKELKNIFQVAQDNKSLMWQTVISFDNRWLEQNNIYNREKNMIDEDKLKQVARLGINRMLEREGLEHAVWSASIHYNTDNIHIHVATVEPYPMRKLIKYQGQWEYKGRFKMKSLELCKSSVVNEILNTKEINHMINNIIRGNIVKAKRERRLAEDPEIRSKFLELYQSLPDVPWNLRHYGNSVMHSCRPLIDDISSQYIKKYHTQEYNEFKNLAGHQSELYDQAYGQNDRSYKNKKEQELMKNLGNAILDEVKEYEKNLKQKINLKQNSMLSKPNDLAAANRTGTDVWEEDIREKPVTEEFSLELNQKHERDASIELLSELEEMETYFDHRKMVHKGSGKNSEVEEKTALGDYKKWYKEFKNIRKALIPDKEGKIDHLTVQQQLDAGKKNNNPFILHLLGELYENNRFFEIDMEKSKQYFLKAFEIFSHDEPGLNTESAEERFNMASYVQYRIGKQLDRGWGTETDYQAAALWYEKSGAGYARYSLGNLYYSGEGVEQDYEEAFRLFESVPDNAFANLKCAQMLKKGQGCAVSLEKSEEYSQEAFKLFTAAEYKQQDDMMEYQLGRMLYYGEGCRQDLDRCIEYLELSAKKHNVNAEYLVSTIYIEQELSDKIPEAIERLEHLADKGNHSNAQYALGKLYITQESEYYNFDRGVAFFHAAAGQGHAYAQYQLGKIYLDHDKEIYDLKKGMGYLMQSAEQKNEYAQYWLGKFYTDTVNEDYDLSKGIHYLELAVEQKNEYAQYRLGTLYTDPEVEIYDLNKGIELLEDSARQGNVYAQYKLGKIYTDPSLDVYDLDKGINYLEHSAGQENEYAHYLLGKLYCDPDLEIYDLRKGIEHLEEAAGQNNQYAQYQLGKLYMDSELEIYNPEKGVFYLEEAKGAGNIPAQYFVGCCYLDKTGPVYHPQKGIDYIRELAENGNSYAQTKLGCEFLKGDSIQRNLNEARSWLSKAAEQENEVAVSILRDIDIQGMRHPGRGRSELDRALCMLQRSFEEEHRRNMQIMRQQKMEQELDTVNEL